MFPDRDQEGNSEDDDESVSEDESWHESDLDIGKAEENNAVGYPCKYCGRVYGSCGSRSSHYYQFHGAEFKAEHPSRSSSQMVSSYGFEYPCKLCANSYEKFASFISHMRIKHPEAYSSGQSLKEANETKRTSDAQKLYKCRYCSQSLSNGVTLSSHLKEVHRCKPTAPQRHRSSRSIDLKTVQGIFDCNYCTAQFDSKVTLTLHEGREHKEDMVSDTEPKADSSHSCTFDGCTKFFSTENRRIAHEDSVHRRQASSSKSVSAKSLICELCLKEYTRTQQLSSHVARVHKKLKGRSRTRTDLMKEVFACVYCPNKYGSFASLYYHHNRQHIDESSPTKKQFNIAGSGNCQSSTGDDPTPEDSDDSTEDNTIVNEGSSGSSDLLKCDECSKVFLNVDFLEKHKLTHASSLKSGPIFCETCGQVFKGIEKLRQHEHRCQIDSSKIQNVTTTVEGNQEYSNKQMSIDLHRKQEHYHCQRKNESLADSENDDSFLTPPPVKRPFNAKVEHHRILTYRTPIATEPPSTDVKLEGEEQLESWLFASSSIIIPSPVPETLSNASGLTNSIVKTELCKNTPMCEPGPRTSTAAIWKDLQTQPCSVKREYCEPKFYEPKPPTIDNDDCIIIEPDTPASTKKQPNLSSGNSDVIEKNPLPLSAAIFTRAAQHPSELMIIWSDSLEEDLISAAAMNSAQCVLCIQELETIKLSDSLREKLKKSEIITITMLSSNDTTSLWAVITFEEQRTPRGLKNKLFRSFKDVEKVFSDYAEARGKTITNLMRYSKEGLFPTLSKKFAKKTMGYNFSE